MANHLRVYHERQVAGLCAVHCLNTLLQGRYFNEIDLMDIANELDEKERQTMLVQGEMTEDTLRFLSETSGNVADDGNYSHQVLSAALAVWNLELIPLMNPKVVHMINNLTELQGFVCHFQNHWFTIRKVQSHWINFDSLLAKPSYLSDAYLSLFINTLVQKGYTIFTVEGAFPNPALQTPIEDTSGGNRFVDIHVGPGASSDQVETPLAMLSDEELMRRAMEMSMLEGAAGSSTYTLENFGSGNNSAVNDDIASMLGDEDEAKAIALSLEESMAQNRETKSPEIINLVDDDDNEIDDDEATALAIAMSLGMEESS